MKTLFQVEIKKPCTVDLSTMSSNSVGKFCTVCQTSVVDFTDKSPDEIALYFKTHSTEKICGTYNRWDVKTDSKLDSMLFYLQNKKLKFAALFIIGLLVLTGCRTRKGRTMGARFFRENTNAIENIK